MFCCGLKPANGELVYKIHKYQKKFRFTEAKLKFYIESFSRIGNSDYFTKEQFRENMGLLGLDSTCLISDRIFSVMCKSNSSQVKLENYLEYMDILLYGSPEEKSEQSFKLITNSDGITFDDFVEWLINVWKMYNLLTGYEISTSSDDIKEYFSKLDRNNDGIIDLQEYKEAMTENKNLYEWFEFAKRGIQNEDDEESVLEMDKWAYEKSLDLIEKDLGSCLETLNDKTFSKRLSCGSMTSRLNRASVRIEDEEEEDNDEGQIEPRYNEGDLDLPEEFDLSEDRNSMDIVSSQIFEILNKVKELRAEEKGKKLSSFEHKKSSSESSVSFT